MSWRGLVPALITVELLSACSAPRSTERRITDVAGDVLPLASVVGQRSPRFTIEERIAFHYGAGVSIAVIDGDKLAFARAWGTLDSRSREPVTPLTLFQAGSVSKPVAALAAMRLVDRGVLTLDGDVNHLLQSWRLSPAPTRAVTLRALLSHTAGLTIAGVPGYRQDSPLPNLTQMLEGTEPAVTEPVRVVTSAQGRFQYSGGGYIVLQQLVSDVTSLPFELAVQQLLLEPLEMQSTGYWQPLTKSPRRAVALGHSLDCRAGHCEAAPIAGGWRVYPELAAAGLWTTPTDLSRLLIALARSWRGERNAVISQASARTMLTSQSDEVTRWGGRFGLGVLVEQYGGEFSFHHSGSNEGYLSYFRYFPERGQGYVIMMNALPETGDTLVDEIVASISREYDMPHPAPRPRYTSRLANRTLDRWVGTYRFLEWPDLTAEVKQDGKALVLQLPWLGPTRLWPARGGRFFSVDGAAFEVDFRTDSSTGETHLDYRLNDIRTTATRVSRGAPHDFN